MAEQLCQWIESGNEETYTLEEEELIEKGKSFFSRYTSSSFFKSIASSHHRVSIKFVNTKGESLGVGVVKATVDAEIAACMAFEFQKDSRFKEGELAKRKVIVQKVRLSVDPLCGRNNSQPL